MNNELNNGIFPKYSVLDKTIGIISGLIAFIGYYLTLTPTIPFWDSGEFIAASSILGIPHQPGSPLYVIFGRIFYMLGLLQDFAARVNILSAIASAATVLVTFFLILEILRWLKGKDEDLPWYAHLSAALGSISMAFSYTFWFNSVEAEVYSTAGLFIVGPLYLFMLWLRRPDIHAFLVVNAYILGLSISNHLTSFIIAPVLLVIVFIKLKPRLGLRAFLVASGFVFVYFITGVFYGKIGSAYEAGEEPWIIVNFMNLAALTAMVALFYTLYYAYKKGEVLKGEIRRFWKIGFLSIVVFFLGLSSHLYLPIRSNLNPHIVNESKPNTWTMFWGFVNRQQYSQISMFERKTSLSVQFKKEFWRYFKLQYFNASSNSGLHPLFATFMLSLVIVLILFGVISPLISWLQDKAPPEDNRYIIFWMLLLLFLIGTIGLFVYLNFSDDEVRDRDYFYAPTYMFCSILMGISIYQVIRLLEDRIYRIAGGVVFTLLVGLGAASWWHEHDRAGNYVASDYGRNILNGMDLNPIVFTNGDNDTFPPWALLCAYYYRPDVRLINLSLINTPWYILQLMVDDPPTNFTMSPEEVVKLDNDLMHKYTETDWKTEVMNGNWGFRKGRSLKAGNITLTVENDVMIPIFRDFMIFSIFEGVVKTKQPVYFAVTVPERNMELYVPLARMEGMVSRITQEPIPNDFHVCRLAANAGRFYNTKSIEGRDVYVDEEARRLSVNYAIGLKRVADWAYKNGYTNLAVRALSKASSFRGNDAKMQLVLAIDLIRLGALDEGKKMFEGTISRFEKELKEKKVPENQVVANKRFAYADMYYAMGIFYLNSKQYNNAKQSLNKAIETFPYYLQAYITYADVLAAEAKYKEAYELLEKFLSLPAVKEADLPKDKKDEIDKKLQLYKLMYKKGAEKDTTKVESAIDTTKQVTKVDEAKKQSVTDATKKK